MMDLWLICFLTLLNGGLQMDLDAAKFPVGPSVDTRDGNRQTLEFVLRTKEINNLFINKTGTCVHAVKNIRTTETNDSFVMRGFKEGKVKTKVKKPRALKIKSLSPTILKVKWRRPKQEKASIKAYKLSWRQKRGKKTQTVNVTSRSYIISGLETNTWYAVSVRAIDVKGRLSNQTSISYKTSLSPVTYPPRNVTVKAVGTTKIKVTWMPPKRNKGKVTNYKIQYKRKGVPRGDLCTVTTNSWKREYTLTDLLKGENYKVRVAAKTGKITGPTSDWISVQLAGKRGSGRDQSDSGMTTHVPTTLSPEELVPELLDLAVSVIPDGVNITWNNVEMGSVIYTLSITEANTILYISEVPYDQSMFEVVKNLQPGKLHNVTVTAIDALGNEIGSDTISFITPVPLTLDIIRDPWITFGENTTLLCVVIGHPKPTVTWLKNDKHSTVTSNEKYSLRYLHGEGTHKYVMKMTIVNVSHEDQTAYNCTVENGVESRTATTDLRYIDSDYVSVTNLTIVSLQPREVTVKWTTPLHHHLLINVTYMIILTNLDDSNLTFTEHEVNNVHTLRNLQPLQSYSVKVVPDGPTEWTDTLSDMITFVTPKELPVPDIEIKTLNSTTLYVGWKKLQEKTLRYYKVIYGIFGDELSILTRKVLPPTSRITLKNLIDNSQYEVRVEAVYTDSVTTSEWRNASTAPEAYLSENVRPPPPADAFLSIQNTSLLVSWLPPHQEYRTLVRHYQLDIYKGSELIIHQQLDAQTRNFTLPNFDKDVDHTVYLTAANRKGTSDFLQRSYKPLSDDKSWSAVTDLRAHPLSSTSILVEWSPPISGLLTRYLVRYRPTSYDETRLKDEWLGPSHNNYAILGLQRFQEYKISVIPFLNEIYGNESFVIAKTLSTPPTAPPQNVTVTSVNHTTMSLSWEPPPSFTRNGILTMYRIAYRKTDQNHDKYVNVDTSVTNVSVTDLLSGTTYEVRIAAVNINGTGPYSDSMTVTTLESPKDKSLPGQPRNLTVLPVPYGVSLRWLPPADSAIPVSGYIVGHGRFIPEVYRETVGADVVKYNVVKLRKNQDYIFSVRAFNNNGESAAVFIVATAGDNNIKPEEDDFYLSNNETESAYNGYDDEPRKLKAELTNNEVPTIRVSWEPPKEARDTIQGYLVNYKVKGDGTWHAILERSQVAEIKNLSFDTTYYIRVQLQYMDGGVGRMSKLLKVKTRSLDDIILVLPTPIITSVFSGTDHLLVSWKPPPSDFLHVVVGYILGYGESDISDHQEFISVSERSFRIGKLKADTQYLISLRMFNEFGESARTVLKANTSSLEVGR